ncbi:NADH-quinone oxidoreductase subunit NuoK [Rickettsiales endosymbiont of Trichoplax sp. H2]|uniref:NADH-quinone oxidoreductase subunit NuoK n=1 Tax=Rickettsiales endosymbiont of Trichoplax sp. H2 TaxID=2021221 RepID=UPI0012B21972|nr:NADH-quinone oxidoreductase subunit NuoK [Rickettsiales endosymbiont of Trichoplax sp. H2]MSO14071.1 NADH-quinone oxidoreductase subunit K [Rickettsiales endosymbiont of Trichoplax sp. H2]
MINNLLIDNVPIGHFLIFSATLFVIGICGIMINKKSIINILFSIEIMLLSVNLNFIAFSKIWIDITGQIFSIFILTVAAAEAAIGLAILVLFFRNKSDISIDRIKKLKG